MSICQATKKNGNKCSYKAKFGNYCGIHKKSQVVEEPVEDEPGTAQSDAGGGSVPEPEKVFSIRPSFKNRMKEIFEEQDGEICNINQSLIDKLVNGEPDNVLEIIRKFSGRQQARIRRCKNYLCDNETIQRRRPMPEEEFERIQKNNKRAIEKYEKAKKYLVRIIHELKLIV